MTGKKIHRIMTLVFTPQNLVPHVLWCQKIEAYGTDIKWGTCRVTFALINLLLRVLIGSHRVMYTHRGLCYLRSLATFRLGTTISLKMGT